MQEDGRIRFFKFDKTKDYFEEQVISSFWVQLLLYLNVYFAGLWFSANVFFLQREYLFINDIQKVLSIMALTVSTLLEVLRLYLGYSGNLQNEIPNFAGFLILSFLIQLPLQTYLLFSQHMLSHVFGTIVQSIMYAILSLQIVFSVPVIRRMSDYRRQQFQAESVEWVKQKRVEHPPSSTG